MKKYIPLLPSHHLSSQKFKYLASKLSNFHVKGVTGTKYNLTPDTFKEITLQRKRKNKLKNIVISNQITHRKGIMSTSEPEKYEDDLSLKLLTLSSRINPIKLASSIKARTTEFTKVGTYSGNSSNYLNTSLPLIPDVRQMSVIKGLKDLAISLFGINRFLKDTSIILQGGGPNGRANRYLKYQYKRLLTRIEALPRVLDPYKGPEIFWNIDFLNKAYGFAGIDLWYSVFLRKYKDTFKGWSADVRPKNMDGGPTIGTILMGGPNRNIDDREKYILPKDRSKLFSQINTKNIWEIFRADKELRAQFRRPNPDGCFAMRVKTLYAGQLLDFLKLS